MPFNRHPGFHRRRDTRIRQAEAQRASRQSACEFFDRVKAALGDSIGGVFVGSGGTVELSAGAEQVTPSRH